MWGRRQRVSGKQITVELETDSRIVEVSRQERFHDLSERRHCQGENDIFQGMNLEATLEYVISGTQHTKDFERTVLERF